LKFLSGDGVCSGARQAARSSRDLSAVALVASRNMFAASKARRWLAGLSLLLAAAMLTLGMTVFGGRLKRYDFLVYWTVCFGLTGFAAVMALLDMAMIKRQSRKAQRDLIQEALNQVEEEKRKRLDH
jgi:hypothetical protein